MKQFRYNQALMPLDKVDKTESTCKDVQKVPLTLNGNHIPTMFDIIKNLHSLPNIWRIVRASLRS